MLNMVITLMSDSFDNFMLYRNVNVLRTKLQILGEQAPLLEQRDKSVSKETIMVVVERDDDAGFETESWEGTINQLSKIIGKQV